jgi:hypothetical protein
MLKNYLIKNKNLSRMGEFTSPEAIQIKNTFALANLINP